MTSYFLRLAVAGSVSHGIAILCTIFRLVYRAWTRHLWWEDAWAALALISDTVCLMWIWIHTPVHFPAWTFGVVFASVVWAARMSIIFSIIRIAHPSCSKIHKWITYFIAVSFACMWAAMLVQKVKTCIYACQMTQSVAVSQMITDVIADVSLIVVPVQLWKNVGLSRNGKILILASFGASLLITVIAIPHSIMLFQSTTEATLIIAHVKAALSLVICNVLVIITLAYRVCWKETIDPGQTFESPAIFSSIVGTQFPFSTMSMASLSAQEETTSSR
ncbi:hypothetical protein DEU56DRAFT_174474 [Suillus clintonianus]|uniref:uncharacterized protein n=1 Tax=Suillus clintonianus TaxID=1904413 RepID=UPI001B87C545|nr:uncharacterized protein DEU56DRAFT_174474 [Suillus clintonianus]KAG2115627.1 hypothetical protein DEU56DRAFT_174474 [Suillus clintonianus]